MGVRGGHPAKATVRALKAAPAAAFAGSKVACIRKQRSTCCSALNVVTAPLVALKPRKLRMAHDPGPPSPMRSAGSDRGSISALSLHRSNLQPSASIYHALAASEGARLVAFTGAALPGRLPLLHRSQVRCRRVLGPPRRGLGRGSCMHGADQLCFARSGPASTCCIAAIAPGVDALSRTAVLPPGPALLPPPPDPAAHLALVQSNPCRAPIFTHRIDLQLCHTSTSHVKSCRTIAPMAHC